MKPRKILQWFETAIAHISAPELITIAINIAAFILSGTFMDNFYLWVVILLCDIMMICAHGAYREALPTVEKGPWYTPAPLLMRLSSTAILFILLAEGRFDSVLSTYAWYTLTITAICHAFYCVLLTMHARDNSWLAGTDGRVGTPNWISIGRMALSVLVPHLFAVQPFGSVSCVIATIFLAVAIITDAADGYLARKLEQTTKAGKALDPLGDKVIFYPMVVAFILATSGTAFLPNAELRIAFFVCIAAMFARDVLFFVWFFLYYTQLKDGIGASMVDKVRMATMCLWLGIAALSLTVVVAHERLALAGFICMALVAILSVISIFVDYDRIRSLLPSKKPPYEPKPDIYGDDDDLYGN